MPLESPETDEQTKLAIIRKNHEISAGEIIDCYDNALRFSKSAKGDADLAIEYALKCGAMCNTKKAELKANTGWGHWENWCEEYLPQIYLHTLQRWMKMAKACHDTLLSSQPKSLRQAYIAVGILPDPVEDQRKRLTGQSKPFKPTNGNSNLRTIITEFRAQKPIEVLVQIQDFSGWDEVELETISRLLAPITAVHSRMIHALSQKLRGNGDTQDRMFTQ